MRQKGCDRGHNLGRSPLSWLLSHVAPRPQVGCTGGTGWKALCPAEGNIQSLWPCCDSGRPARSHAFHAPPLCCPGQRRLPPPCGAAQPCPHASQRLQGWAQAGLTVPRDEPGESAASPWHLVCAQSPVVGGGGEVGSSTARGSGVSAGTTCRPSRSRPPGVSLGGRLLLSPPPLSPLGLLFSQHHCLTVVMPGSQDAVQRPPVVAPGQLSPTYPVGWQSPGLGCPAAGGWVWVRQHLGREA